jgi:hypothetical protein
VPQDTYAIMLNNEVVVTLILGMRRFYPLWYRRTVSFGSLCSTFHRDSIRISTPLYTFPIVAYVVVELKQHKVCRLFLSVGLILSASNWILNCEKYAKTFKCFI